MVYVFEVVLNANSPHRSIKRIVSSKDFPSWEEAKSWLRVFYQKVFDTADVMLAPASAEELAEFVAEVRRRYDQSDDATVVRRERKRQEKATARSASPSGYDPGTGKAKRKLCLNDLSQATCEEMMDFYYSLPVKDDDGCWRDAVAAARFNVSTYTLRRVRRGERRKH